MLPKQLVFILTLIHVKLFSWFQSHCILRHRHYLFINRTYDEEWLIATGCAWTEWATATGCAWTATGWTATGTAACGDTITPGAALATAITQAKANWEFHWFFIRNFPSKLIHKVVYYLPIWTFCLVLVLFLFLKICIEHSMFCNKLMICLRHSTPFIWN